MAIQISGMSVYTFTEKTLMHHPSFFNSLLLAPLYIPNHFHIKVFCNHVFSTAFFYTLYNRRAYFYTQKHHITSNFFLYYVTSCHVFSLMMAFFSHLILLQFLHITRFFPMSVFTQFFLVA